MPETLVHSLPSRALARRSDMQSKFTQVNEFLKLLGHTGVLEQMASEMRNKDESREGGRTSSSRICILDCGCGSAHLTFGTFHYLNNVLGLPSSILGVDTNGALMQRSNNYRQGL